MAAFALSYNDTELSLVIPLRSDFERTRIRLPAGVVQSGVIVDQAKFAEIIMQTLVSRKVSIQKNLKIVIALPEEHAFIKSVEVPGKLKKKELESAFAFQWQSILPISADQVYYEYTPLNKVKKKDALQRFLIVAYPKTIIDSLIATFEKVKILPVKLLPLSFGYAELFSLPTGVASLMVGSQDGKNISVAVIQNGLIRLSTIIHTKVDTPTAYRQIENIKRFYEQTVTDVNDKIASVKIIPSRYADLLSKQLTSLSLPIEVMQQTSPTSARKKKKASSVYDSQNLAVEISKTNGGLKIKGAGDYLYESDLYIPLLGLLKSRSPLSIIPPHIKDALVYEQQYRVFRVNLTIVIAALFLSVYMQGLLYFFVKSNTKLKVTTPPELAQKITQQEGIVGQEVSTINAQASQLTALNQKRTKSATTIAAIRTIAAASNGIQLDTITYDVEKRSLTLLGSRTSRIELTQFVTNLKANSAVESANISLASLQAEGVSPFEVAVVIKEKP